MIISNDGEVKEALNEWIAGVFYGRFAHLFLLEVCKDKQAPEASKHSLAHVMSSLDISVICWNCWIFYTLIEGAIKISNNKTNYQYCSLFANMKSHVNPGCGRTTKLDVPGKRSFFQHNRLISSMTQRHL